MRRHWQYLKYVLRHKWFVLLAGLELGVPILMLIFHDWDKFLPDEWFPYARTFYKPDGTSQYVPDKHFALAWKKHQHRNKHHWQWWLNFRGSPLSESFYMVWDKGNVSFCDSHSTFDVPDGMLDVREPMPDVYRREMLADWIGAGRAIHGGTDPTDWYLANKDNMVLHAETHLWIQEQLGITYFNEDIVTVGMYD